MGRRMKTTPIPVDRYRIKDPFWGEKTELVRTHMIPYQWRVLNDAQEGAVASHCIRNFRIAAGLEEGDFGGYVFQDSDLAKWLEAVGYSLANHKDPELEALADSAIDLILQAQQPDGYMDTYYIINGLEKAWTNIADNHELYCAGHMIEAAVAYYKGTGKRSLLDGVVRLADCIDRHFGPEEGKLHGYPGHEILEMALIRLYHVTGEKRYRELAAYFINERGREPNFFAEERIRNGNDDPWKDSAFHYQYYQAAVPVREQKKAVGHAVRAMYLYSGMAAVAKETEDESLYEACRTLWEDVTRRQMYITGAVGASPYGEAFTFDYDLPNDTVYGETCASIGLVFWARRMAEMELDRSYGEVMERCLYNSCLSGMSKEGNSFFYVNPLEVLPEASAKDEGKRHVLTKRRTWFNCACCPPNLARMLTSVGHYACTEGEDLLAFHLYVGGVIQSERTGLTLEVTSGLPSKGEVTVKVLESEGKRVSLCFRIPSWCSGRYTVAGNRGEALREEKEENGFRILTGIFLPGEEIRLSFDMPVRLMQADPRVREDVGKVAVTRGPLVYCLEEADNGDGLHRIHVDRRAEFRLTAGRVQQGPPDLETEGFRLADGDPGSDLYVPWEKPVYENVPLHLIPYYLWNNRGEGEMMVWLHGK